MTGPAPAKPPAPTPPPTISMGKKREVDPSEIVDCAIGVLADVGFAKFSGLKVAETFGIRQSHLTYYFPTKDDLIAAMSERLVKRYAEFVEGLCRDAMRRPGNPIAIIIDQLMVDAVSPPTSVLFPAMWEAASNDTNIADALENIYRSSQARMILMLGVDPASPQAEPVWRVINLLGVIIEGCTAIYGRREPDDPELTRLRETAKGMLIPAFEEALKRR